MDHAYLFIICWMCALSGRLGPGLSWLKEGLHMS